MTNCRGLNNLISSASVIGVSVNVFRSVSEAATAILDRWQLCRGGYVCVANTHMCVAARKDISFMHVLENSTYIVADGWPLSAIQRKYGHKNASQIRGEDLMISICGLSEKKSLSVGLYGSSSGTLEKLKTTLLANFPDLDISYCYSPPYRDLSPTEKEHIINEISSSNVAVLFVGLGCPKQEIWMSDMADKLPVMQIGVGAAFDFISGVKRSSPRWLRSCGLEWLHRLASEPKRLFIRYTSTIPMFMYLLFLQIIRGKK